ncbi:unnamed protein product [Periconia digitata]|uniref:Exonuclease domain-containing protein n=1 Tax=Periconia digitata TaxID=1303443 RepID=A0A9W4UAH2_9PLEO|nr:unnamed protein product [Periconia digitata]
MWIGDTLPGRPLCPQGTECKLPRCMFYHEISPSQGFVSFDNDTTRAPPSATPADQDQQPARLKLDFQASPYYKPPQNIAALPKSPNPLDVEPSRTVASPKSPPPTRDEPNAASEAEVQVRLAPRPLKKEPVNYVKRTTLLKALHQYMEPFNAKLRRAVKLEYQVLHLSPNLLIKLAVDEEETIAKEHCAVYENVMKQRLFALKKMKLEQWVKMRREAIAQENGNSSTKPVVKRVISGLKKEYEVMVLRELKATKQQQMAYDVVTEMPTEADIAAASYAQELAFHWEVCDRCHSRFQVFPERRQRDGVLTTKDTCRHHWGKKFRPMSQPGQPLEPYIMRCCNEPVGSPGCTVGDTHVFKINFPARMALVMPFIETPENKNVGMDTAVSFDCEMAYTTYGLELMRLTVVSWPDPKPLVDVLVRPLGHVLDFNTRFSGITAQQFLDAKPYDPENPKPVKHDLRIVDSPMLARDLLLSHISPQTPLIGHAIENDLNAVRLIHPTIIDTVILFPARGGPPFRNSLKNLAKWHLNWDIQQGGADGHDSYEDSKTTGELARFRLAEFWQGLRTAGHSISRSGIIPPLSKAPSQPPWRKNPMPQRPPPGNNPSPPMNFMQQPPPPGVGSSFRLGSMPPPPPPPPGPPSPPSEAPSAPTMIGNEGLAASDGKRKRWDDYDDGTRIHKKAGRDSRE